MAPSGNGESRYINLLSYSSSGDVKKARRVGHGSSTDTDSLAAMLAKQLAAALGNLQGA
jgi:hypothetical protein